MCSWIFGHIFIDRDLGLRQRNISLCKAGVSTIAVFLFVVHYNGYHEKLKNFKLPMVVYAFSLAIVQVELSFRSQVPTFIPLYFP